jgi:hypothetical protein
MAYMDWMLKTRRLSTCSCDYGCPCEFNAPPTQGFCEGVEAMEIDEGYFGDVRLDGLRTAGIYHWPGAVHQGGGSWLAFMDERATPEQREALQTILTGKEQEPTTAINIFGSTVEHDLGTRFVPIEFEWDIQNRTGRIAVSGLLQVSIEPIRNPVTDQPHRAIIKLPEGFEYREAEMASASFWSKGEITQEHHKRFGFLTYVTNGPYGVIEKHSYPLAQ